MLTIDLNADVGEWEGPEPSVTDAALLTVVSSASVACGGHAGSVGAMRHTVALAAAHGVAVGAHPGFEDRARFGRRELPLPAGEVTDLIRNQVLRLADIAAREGVRLAHVKPHGALYNMASRRGDLADAIAVAVASVDTRLALFGLAGSALIAAGRAAGLRTVAEAFADRAYLRDGSLAPRSSPGAVLNDPEMIATRAVRLVREGQIRSLDGESIAIAAGTLCLHGDTPGAAALARRVRDALVGAGISVSAPQ